MHAKPHKLSRPADSGPFFSDTLNETFGQFRVASFDVFDTLIYRRVAKAVDVFKIIERRHDDIGFAKRRVQAEALAREVAQLKFCSSETSLEDIYRVLSDDPQIQCQGIARELAAESSCLTAHPFGLELYKKAKAMGLTVVAVSDMYLSSSQIENLLVSCGIYVDRVFSSSDWREDNCGKYNGKAFARVADTLGVEPSDIIHFGDNHHSDFISANENGVSAVHVSSAFEEMRLDPRINSSALMDLCRQESLEASLALGLLSCRLREGYFGTHFNATRAFGYLQGGLTAVAFLQFIGELADRDAKERVFLLTRDGFSLKAAAAAYGFDLKRLSILWSSRRMALVPLLARQEFWVLQSLFPWREGEFQLSRELERLHLDMPDEVEDFRTTNYDDFLAYLRKIGPRWAGIVNAEVSSYPDYLKGQISSLSLDKVALVDVGWGLVSHRAIDQMLETKIDGYYLGTHERAYDNGKIHGLFFKGGAPTERCALMMNAVELLELIFSDPSPSAIRMAESKNGYEPEFERRDAHDISRDLFVREVRAGMLDFIADISPFKDLLTLNGLREAAAAACLAAMTKPTPQERFHIGGIPHVREVGKSKFHPISNWWRLPETPPIALSPIDMFADVETETPQPSSRRFYNVAARRILTPILGHKRVSILSNLIYNRG